MNNRIIVAGGGHGGIAAAAILAEKGFDVTVYERHDENALGYDWTDIFDKRGFTACGIPLPPRDKYLPKNDMTFYPPSLTHPITQQTLPEKREIQMERRDIYSHLVAHARGRGVKFEFGVTVEAPVFLGGRVAGIRTDRGEYLADLVIDACGADSPLRRAMPEWTGIQRAPEKYEVFYVYRAFYERVAPIPENNFKVVLLHGGKLGICWIAPEEEHTDVLIGRFEPFDEEEVSRTLAELRESEPALGEKRLRGGEFVKIPVRQPLAVLVADGYAAIGDSAFMTVPLIGSGIANSLKAARILADAVLADKNREYNASTLWRYQTGFYRKLGSGLAPIACMKLLLTRLTVEDVEFVFEHGLLTGEELTMDCDSNSISSFASHMDVSSMPYKVKTAAGRPALVKALAWCGSKITAASAVCAAMPREYDRAKVVSWAKAYNKVFTVADGK